MDITNRAGATVGSSGQGFNPIGSGGSFNNGAGVGGGSSRRYGRSGVYCLIDLNKKKNRDFYYDHIEGPHEARFDNINKMPQPFTKVKHVAGPEF